MKTLHAQIPDSLLKQVTALAKREKTSIDQIVALALSAQVEAWKIREDMDTRDRRAIRPISRPCWAKVPTCRRCQATNCPKVTSRLAPNPANDRCATMHS